MPERQRDSQSRKQDELAVELRALENCTDEMLIAKLPDLGASPESLAVGSMADRSDKILAALQRQKRRGSPDIKAFRQSLNARMDERGAEKKRRLEGPRPSAQANPMTTTRSACCIVNSIMTMKYRLLRPPARCSLTSLARYLRLVLATGLSANLSK